MRIMIVDDELTSRNALKLVMTEFGECVLVDSGRKAVEQFIEAWSKWKPIDLVMLDIELSDTSGLNVLQDIRMLEKEKEIPPEDGVRVIMVTGNSAKDVVIECLKAGCSEFVVKPVDKQTMRDKLQKIGAGRVFSS
jgi:two-component system chemotaxis response regulator CheY